MSGKFFTMGSLVVALMAATGGAATAASCLENIRQSGTLRVGNGIMGLKPFVWQKDDGTYTGFENEILERLVDKLGVDNYEYVVTEWTTLIPGLHAGRWDVIVSAMAATQERIQGGNVAFSDPYFMYVDRIIVTEGSPINSEADLKGKILASTMGTMDSLVAHSLVDQGIAGSVVDFNSFGEPFVALRNGQADAVILDQTTFSGQQEDHKDLRVVGAPLYYIPKAEWAEAEEEASYELGAVGVGMKPECADLLEAVNMALAEIDASGERQAIMEKYGLWDESQVNMKK